MRLHSVYCALVLCLLAATPSIASSKANKSLAALPVQTSFAAPVAEARAPFGWLDFCERHHEDCDGAALAPQDITLSKANWTLLQKVNLTVNRTIHEAEDMAVYGVAERWEYPSGGFGDCEDFALLKRKELIDAGLPRQALLMTVVTDEVGSGHAILTARTDRGDFILDNRNNRILPWQATGYGFVKRQSQTSPDVWVRLGEPAAPLLTATAQR